MDEESGVAEHNQGQHNNGSHHFDEKFLFESIEIILVSSF